MERTPGGGLKYASHHTCKFYVFYEGEALRCLVLVYSKPGTPAGGWCDCLQVMPIVMTRACLPAAECCECATYTPSDDGSVRAGKVWPQRGWVRGAELRSSHPLFVCLSLWVKMLHFMAIPIPFLTHSLSPYSASF